MPTVTTVGTTPVTNITTEKPSPSPQPTPTNEVPKHDGHKITSPMVGTFYAGSSPNSSPYIEIGTEVEIGDTLCIIEAMKMMNQIESDAKGRITTILAKNGDPIEFGQILFLIKE